MGAAVASWLCVPAFRRVCRCRRCPARVGRPGGSRFSRQGIFAPRRPRRKEHSRGGGPERSWDSVTYGDMIGSVGWAASSYSGERAQKSSAAGAALFRHRANTNPYGSPFLVRLRRVPADELRSNEYGREVKRLVFAFSICQFACSDDKVQLSVLCCERMRDEHCNWLPC